MGPELLRSDGIRGRELLLSSDVISLLRKLLQDIGNFDEMFLRKDQQESLFEFDSKAMDLRSWYERIHLLPREKRIKIQQTLRESDDLYERVYEAMKASNVSSAQSHAIVPAIPTASNWWSRWVLG